MTQASAHRVPPYKRPIVIASFLLVLAAAICIAFFICKSFFRSDTSPEDTSRPGQNTDVTPPETTPPANPDDDLEHKTPQYEGADPNLSSELTGVVIYKDIDPENLTLHSAVNIDQYLQEDGQCVYNIKRDGAIVRTASAIATPDITTSVCGPFSISVADLAGDYDIEVIITGDSKRGIITDVISI